MTNEDQENKSTGEDTDKGSELSTDEENERKNAAAERLEKATEEARKFGVADAGQSSVKKEETDHEYRLRIEKEIEDGVHD